VPELAAAELDDAAGAADDEDFEEPHPAAASTSAIKRIPVNIRRALHPGRSIGLVTTPAGRAGPCPLFRLLTMRVTSVRLTASVGGCGDHLAPGLAL
jgi:hypothetical protein